MRQMGRRCLTFKRATDVAGGIGRVADGLGDGLSFVPGSRVVHTNDTYTTVQAQGGPGQAGRDVMAPSGAAGGRRGKEKWSISRYL
jgi:hypothetical protein